MGPSRSSSLLIGGDSSAVAGSGQTELRDRVQWMTEEAVKLKFDLKHTLSARARAEGREDEA